MWIKQTYIILTRCFC